MEAPEHILQELRTGVAAALQRAEERMSHVQRQLAGWQAPPKLDDSSPPDAAGWKSLEQNANTIAGEVDADLAYVQQALTSFLQQSRELQASLRPQSS